MAHSDRRIEKASSQSQLNNSVEGAGRSAAFLTQSYTRHQLQGPATAGVAARKSSTGNTSRRHMVMVVLPMPLMVVVVVVAHGILDTPSLWN